MIYPNYQQAIKTKQDVELSAKIASLASRWDSEDRWHSRPSTSNHTAQTRLRSWTREYGDEGFGLLYAQWKVQLHANTKLQDYIEIEMHQAAGMLIPASINPEDALTPGIRAMAEVQSQITAIRKETKQMRDAAEDKLESLEKESRELQAEMDEIMEMIDDKIILARRKIRSNPLHHIAQEDVIKNCHQMKQAFQDTKTALGNLDGPELLAKCNHLQGLADLHHKEMPAICNSIVAMNDMDLGSNNLNTIADLPLQLMSDIHRMNQLAGRMEELWMQLGQESVDYFAEALVDLY